MTRAELSYEDGGPAPETNPDFWNWLCNATKNVKDKPAVWSLKQVTSHLTSFAPGSRPEPEPEHSVWTYNDLIEAAEKIANICYSYGVRPGDRFVVYFDHGCIDWAIYYWASARLGTTLVSLNPASLDDSTLTNHFLPSLKPRVLVVRDVEMAVKFDSHGAVEDPLVKLISAPQAVTPATTSWTYVGNAKADRSAPPHPLQDRDHVSQIVYSSGSTNLPKGCLLKTSMIQSEIAQLSAMKLGWSTDTRMMYLTKPFMAIGYLGSLCTWQHGGCVVFRDNDASRPRDTVQAIQESATTHIWNMPSALAAMSSAIRADLGLAPKTLQYAITSGETTHDSDLKNFKQALKAEHVVCMWGMTEGCPGLGYLGHTTNTARPTATPAKIATIGKALAGTAVKVSDHSHEPVPRGDFGALHVSAKSFIDDYLDGRAAEDFYTDENGRRWFMTGDLALMDEKGFVYLLGRASEQFPAKDGVIVPSIVDVVVKSAFGVDTAVCLCGLPDPNDEKIRIPVAVLPLSQDEIDQSTPKALETVQAELESGWVPKCFVSLDQLGTNGKWPLTPTSKIKRRGVTERLLELQQKGVIVLR